jgi:hypothetical protein
MEDLYDTNFHSNGELCKICIRYNSDDHFTTVDHLALALFKSLISTQMEFSFIKSMKEKDGHILKIIIKLL